MHALNPTFTQLFILLPGISVYCSLTNRHFVLDTPKHRLNMEVRSPKFIFVLCAQLYSLAEAPHPPSHCIWAHIRRRFRIYLFVTGPNMSGKSTYLRQVILLSIMGQVCDWCFYKISVLRIRDVYPGFRILIFTHPGSKNSNERQG